MFERMLDDVPMFNSLPLRTRNKHTCSFFPLAILTVGSRRFVFDTSYAKRKR